jgi:hypothetical protein
MGDLGNLSGFLKEGNIADLDWLNVDAEKYREEAIVPKENFEVRPDLEALWAHRDEPAAKYFVPNKVPVPPFKGGDDLRTMGDMSQAHGPLSGTDLIEEDVRKLARIAIMQSPDLGRLRDTLLKRFDLQTITAHRAVLAEVVQERGLLGKLYIAASDFNCETGQKLPGQFARRYSTEALYVVAKDNCAGCSYAKTAPNGAQNCAVFHKEIVLDVPYSDALAEAVEETQKSRGKEVQASKASPKERIRLALLSTDLGRPLASGPYQGQGTAYIRAPVQVAPEVANQQLIAAGALLKKKNGDLLRERKATEVTAFLQREMLKGLDVTEVLRGLKMSFPVADLQDTRTAWEPLFREAGLYGHVYSTQESFDDCHTGADFLAKHNHGVRAIVEGPKCASCIYHKVSRCMLYGKSVIASPEVLYTPETVEAVLLEFKTAGRLPPWDGKVASNWGPTPREQLKLIHRSISRDGVPLAAAPGRMDLLRAFRGTITHQNTDPARRPEVLAARKFLNEGLYGNQLKMALRLQFEPGVLIASANELRPVLAEQGLQGIYYIDPTVYADYGSGCDEAMRLHRSRLVEYVKIGPKCSSCVFQTQLGVCSKLAKTLVHEPPYVDKVAQQTAVLTSGASMEFQPASLMQKSNIMVEYEMQHGSAGMTVEVDAPRQARLPMPIEFNNRKLNL